MKTFKIPEINKVLAAFEDRGYKFQSLHGNNQDKEKNIFISKLQDIDDRDYHNGEHAITHLYNREKGIQLNVRFNDASFVNETKEHFILSGRIEAQDQSMGGGSYTDINAMIEFIDKLEAKQAELKNSPSESALTQ